jgi:glycolate oxidase iron-sulfur subunit
MTTRGIFEPALKLGQAVRPLVPSVLKDKVPVARAARPWPIFSESRTHVRKVLMLHGCVQPAMAPSIDASTARVLDRLGVQTIVAQRSGCCGAVKHHLNDHDGGLMDARRNIDAWWPYIDPNNSAQNNVEAIIMNASGCGAMVKEYGHLLRHDADYAKKAERVSQLCKDLVEFVPDLLMQASIQSTVKVKLTQLLATQKVKPKVAFHPPCTLQHGQQIKGAVEALLTDCGAHVLPVTDSHLCCGSAGTYSVLQPELSKQLRERKINNLQTGQPEVILSANIGCLAHLQAGTSIPVIHWVEWLDEVLSR